MEVPATRYAKSGDVHIAYQVFGNGPLDVVMVPGFVSNVEYYWEIPQVPEIFERFASFARMIIWDKRGTGLSDPCAGVPTLDERMDDLRAVMDASGSESAALFGVSEGGPMSIVFAATYPERVRALALYGTTPRFAGADDFPHGWQPLALPTMLERIDRGWGTGILGDIFGPSVADDPRFQKVWARYERTGASPSMAKAVVRALHEIDIRSVLPSIHIPTLIIHRTDELVATVYGARLMAEKMPDATLIELPGMDHVPFVGDWEAIVDHIEEFLTGERSSHKSNRILATVLFTDIVRSTDLVARLGDRRWREVLEEHDTTVRRQLSRFRGREVKHTGDGFLAAFDGPGRAVECAVAISRDVRPLGIEVRAGVHTGECEQRGDDLGGIGVHIGARIASLAQPSEVLASGTVKDLVVGSGLRFVDRGEHELKGVPDRWRVFAVAN